MDVKITDRGKGMSTRLDEFKDGEPADFKAMARNRDYYEMQQIFLAEYDRLIREGQDCDWPHEDILTKLQYSQYSDSFSVNERTITEHGNYVISERPCMDIYSDRLAKVLAYDAFRAIKILWEEKKFMAVKGKPKLMVREGEFFRDFCRKVTYAWYAEIYS